MGDFQSRNGTAILIVTVGWLLVGWLVWPVHIRTLNSSNRKNLHPKYAKRFLSANLVRALNKRVRTIHGWTREWTRQGKILKFCHHPHEMSKKALTIGCFLIPLTVHPPMNPFSYVVQVVAGFSVGFLLLRPDTVLPSKEIKWPHDVPMTEETLGDDKRRVMERQETAFTSFERTKRGGGPARGQWGISPRAKGEWDDSCDGLVDSVSTLITSDQEEWTRQLEWGLNFKSTADCSETTTWINWHDSQLLKKPRRRGARLWSRWQCIHAVFEIWSRHYKRDLFSCVSLGILCPSVGVVMCFRFVRIKVGNPKND